MPKFAKMLRRSYMENNQVNPLRWEMLYYNNEDDVFYPQTAKFKCKDYFNDVVAWYHGHKIAVYGMDLTEMKFNTEGVWVRMKEIQDKESFEHNFNNLIAPKLKEQLGIEMSVEVTTRRNVVVLFPRKLFDNTYRISLFTWLIRLSNYGYKAESLEDLFVGEGRPQKMVSEVTNMGFGYQTRPQTVLFNNWFLVPPQLEGEWYWQGEQYKASREPKPYANVAHNCGMYTWINYMLLRGVV